MRIFRVGVTYGELRSTGYPTFSTRHEVSLTAIMEDGETATECARRLQTFAKAEVNKRFGDVDPELSTEMERPYHKPEQESRP